MKFDIALPDTHKLLATIEALRNASTDGYKLSAYEKTLLLDASFIFQAIFDQTIEGKRLNAILNARNRNIVKGE